RCVESAHADDAKTYAPHFVEVKAIPNAKLVVRDQGNTVASADGSRQITNDPRVRIGITSGHLPLIDNVARESSFKTLGSCRTAQDEEPRIGRVRKTGIGPVELVQRCRVGKTRRNIPFEADFLVHKLFRFKIDGASCQTVELVT